MAIRHEDVLASMSPESRARIVQGSAEWKADYRTFLELQKADASTRETPEFYAKLSSLSEEFRAELLRQEVDRAGLGLLKKQVEALGGKLKITAEFPSGATLVIDEE